MKKNFKQLKTKILSALSLSKIKGGGVIVDDLIDGLKPIVDGGSSVIVDDLVDGV